MLWGYHAVYDHDYYDALDYAHENGYDYVAFDLNIPRFYLDGLSDTELDKLRTYAQAKGIGLSFHAPADNISLYADFPDVRAGILMLYKKILHATDRLGARQLTIHTGHTPSFRKHDGGAEDYLREYGDYYAGVLYENIRTLTNYAQHTLISVENDGFTPWTMNTVERLLADTPLRLTLDLPKSFNKDCLLLTEVDAFMRRHTDKISELHAHDLSPTARRHQRAGTGVLDFTQYREFFRSDMAVTLEVRPREEATRSREYLLNLFGK